MQKVEDAITNSSHIKNIKELVKFLVNHTLFWTLAKQKNQRYPFAEKCLTGAKKLQLHHTAQ